MESSLLGYRTLGSDLDPDMLRGAERNVTCFSGSAELFRSDIGDLPVNLGGLGMGQVDGIVTDMPYGRASTTFGEEPGLLFGRTLASVGRVLRPRGYAVLITSDPAAIRGACGGLRLVSCFRLRVHGSLTRYVVVYQREPVPTP